MSEVEPSAAERISSVIATRTQVEAMLADVGVARRSIEVVGRGEEFPVATNDTGEGRQENRRVVVTLS